VILRLRTLAAYARDIGNQCPVYLRAHFVLVGFTKETQEGSPLLQYFHHFFIVVRYLVQFLMSSSMRFFLQDDRKIRLGGMRL
jgi:hypothetical protein